MRTRAWVRRREHRGAMPKAALGLAMLTPPRLCFGALVLGLGLLPSSTTAAQQQPFASVHWPLLDVVTVPDSCTGIRVIVAPSPATTAWKKGPQVVQFGLDPVEALQWATLARAFAHSDTATSSKPRTPLRYLPALRPSRGRRLLLLADYGTRAKPDRRYLLVVQRFRRAGALQDLCLGGGGGPSGRPRSPSRPSSVVACWSRRTVAPRPPP